MSTGWLILILPILLPPKFYVFNNKADAIVTESANGFGDPAISDRNKLPLKYALFTAYNIEYVR